MENLMANLKYLEKPFTGAEIFLLGEGSEKRRKQTFKDLLPWCNNNDVVPALEAKREEVPCSLE